MSVLRPGDEEMHYCDGSHRWAVPPGRGDQAAWEERVREHQRQHRQHASRSSTYARSAQRTTQEPRQRTSQTPPRSVR